MNTLAKKRRAKRFKNGSLSLDVPKLVFKLDDNGNPTDFESYSILDSNKLVEVGPGCRLPTFRVCIKRRLRFFWGPTCMPISHWFKLRARQFKLGGTVSVFVTLLMLMESELSSMVRLWLDCSSAHVDADVS